MNTGASIPQSHAHRKGGYTRGAVASDAADDPSSTRGRILSAAMDVLDRKGPAHIGIRAIAQKAKVSVGLVHHYFTSKDGLLEACVSQLYDALLAVEGEQRERLENDDLHEALDHSVRRGYRIASENRVLVRVVMRFVAERGGLPGSLRESMQARYLDDWGAIVARRTGLEEWDARARVHSVTAMTGRYAAASATELAAILGEPDMDEPALRQRAEDHLAWLAKRIPDT